MCGRFVITSAPEALRALFGYAEQPNFPPRYNIAPTQPVPVVILEAGKRHFRLMRWGLLPAWVKDPRKFALVINARSETVLEKPAFRAAMKRRRVLIPADGYYEWQAEGPRKQPYFIHRRDRAAMGLAALAETWTGPNGEELDSVAIVTAAASPRMAVLHHRVPVTIAPSDFERWLDGNATDPEEAARLLRAPPDADLAWHAVSTAVNRVQNDGPELLLPISTEQRAADDTAKAPPKASRPQKPRDDKRKTAQSRDKQGSLF